MDAALGWFGDVFRFLMKLCPHLVIVKTTDEALKWVRGSEEVLLTSSNGCRRCIPQLQSTWPFFRRPRTGLHWYLPVVTELLVIPVRRQTLNLEDQYLTTKDSKSVGVGGILVWEVKDTRVLLTSCEDYEDTMKDISLAVVKRVITTKDFQWFVDNPHDADKMLTQAIRRELNPFGIRTKRCTLSDFCLIRPLGLWGSGSM